MKVSEVQSSLRDEYKISTGFSSDESLGYFPPTLRVENLADALRIHNLRETLH
jgi:hypothetical protein